MEYIPPREFDGRTFAGDAAALASSGEAYTLRVAADPYPEFAGRWSVPVEPGPPGPRIRCASRLRPPPPEEPSFLPEPVPNEVPK
jgi:hypothetical protein